MESTVNNRIRSILKRERLSILALSKMINMQQVTLNRQISGESSMTLETFISIMNCFPKVSLDWILRGEGEMIKGSNSTGTTNSEFVVYADENGFLKLKR